MANEVFISYSRKDFEKVKAVKEEIDRLVGIDCWMDLNGIESGDWFKKVIISAINRHNTLLFMLTSNSMNSRFAMKELGFAASKGKRIVLVDLEHTQLNDEFLFDYSDKDNVNWNDPLQYEKLVNNLRTWFPVNSTIKEEQFKYPTEYYDIFISYSFEHGFDAAKSIYKWLSGEGYSVFFDESSLRTGKRDAQSIRQTLHCKDFLLFVDSHFTDRFSEEDDWGRNELSTVIKRGCNEVNIIPITMNDLINNRNIIIEKLYSHASQLNDYYSRTPEMNVIPKQEKIKQDVERKAIEMLLAMVRSSINNK